MNFNINLVSRDNRKNFSLIFDETNNVNDFLSIFSVDKDSQEIFIGPYVWSFKVSTKLNEFVEKWQDQIPQLKGILAFFDKLCEGETFFMFPNLPIERQQQQLNIELAIKDHYENISPQAMQCVSNKIGNRLETYHMYSIGDERMVLGTNADKCRFCKKTASEHEATFKKEAHAIPEGLGNKTVKSKDECDICNDKFSETIEPDLIKYLSFYRTIWEIKGKGGEKEIKENNFLFSKKALDGENLEAVKKF